MNENLPDINFKEKKEKKGGALGWFKNKLGWGSRGAMGEAGINPAAMNAGRAAFGAGKFGASAGSGIAGLLAGKASTIAAIAMVAVASGVYLASNSPAPGSNPSAFSSGRTSDNYVPAILRSQAANQGSSLDMFKETNKGAGLAMEADPNKAAKAADPGKPTDAAADAEAQDPNAPQQGDGTNMAGDMMAKLQGGNMASLTSQLGGGSNKMSGMGGFSNKFNQGQTGNKLGFTSGIGTGFSSMPKFDSRKNKMLAMKGSARPVFGGSKAGKAGKIGAGAFGQAKGMKAIQQSYSGTSIDGARSTQDKAWEGSTGEGTTSGGGAGLSDGGAGIVTSPSIDNAGDMGGGGGAGTPTEPVVPEATGPVNVSPWSTMTMMAMMLILMSALLAGIGAKLIQIGDKLLMTPYTAAAGAAIRGMGMMLCGVAIALGAAALIMGIMIMQQHGQAMLGTVYTIGAGCAIAAAGMAMAGVNLGPITPVWMAAAAGVIALIGSMLGGK